MKEDLKGFEQAQLGRVILDDRLDDQACRGEGIEAVRRLDPRKRGVALIRRQTALVDHPGKRCGDLLLCLCQRRLFDVVEKHGMAGRRGHLRDPGAHGAGA